MAMANRALLFLTTTILSILAHLNPSPQASISQLLLTDPISISAVSTDFGRLASSPPAAVLRPSSPLDIATFVRSSFSSSTPFPISARGHGHSAHGQALAPADGVVMDMAALREGGNRIRILVDGCGGHVVDAGGEQLWIDVLHEALKHGVAPRSWTDYLHLTVGGTLSNAGISGQAFRHGPQISNVQELDVITGKGEMVTCSMRNNSDLFLAVLGGLGQFGIITRARIAVGLAPRRVRWLRLMYADFGAFVKDQEHLISLAADDDKIRGFDYVEGSVMLDQSLSSSRGSSFFKANDMQRIVRLGRGHGAIYCLEGAVYYDSTAEMASLVDEALELLLEELSFVPGFVFTKDVSYAGFLDRVHDGELELRSLGLWDVPHPWLNLFVPKSRIMDFDRHVFKGILNHNSSSGPILVYPVNKNKWDERTSAVIPDEEIFYSVGLLRSATFDNWRSLEDQNEEILQFCDRAGIGYKQYLPHYRSMEGWKRHFGAKWDMFVAMKRRYDPKAILSPGQRIFASPLAQQRTCREQ